MQARADALPPARNPDGGQEKNNCTHTTLRAGGSWTKGRILGLPRRGGKGAYNGSSRAAWADHRSPPASAWYSPRQKRVSAP
eukprot:1094173-Pelagomonas_calceolata.AAC.9